MSHYTVLVIGDNVDEKLAPFDENLSVEPYHEPCYCRRHNAFQAASKQAREEMSLPEREDDWTKEQRVAFQNRFQELVRANPRLEPDPECESCNGSGVVETTYNPDSKWDWYSIGGRWMGKLVLKPGGQGVIGRPGVFGNEPINPEGVDSAQVGDIDWDEMNKPSKQDIEEANRLWDWIEGKVSEEELRRNPFFSPFSPERYIARYGTREEYIRRTCSFKTYAVITEDGKWHAPGEMGWFGTSTESDDSQLDWDENFFTRFIEPLEPHVRLTVVDCHI